MVTPVKGWVERFKAFPGLKVFPNACQYPDDTLDVFIFDTYNLFLKSFYSKYLYYPSIGVLILRKLTKRMKVYQSGKEQSSNYSSASLWWNLV